MSQQNALNFIREVRRNPELRKRVNGLKGASAVRELTAMAAEYAFQFTEEDYRAAVAALSKGELDPSAIESLARDMGITR